MTEFRFLVIRGIPNAVSKKWENRHVRLIDQNNEHTTMSRSAMVINVRQDGLLRSSAVITLDGVKYGRGSDHQNCVRIDAANGVMLEISGGPAGTCWEQFLGRTRHSIQVDGKEVAFIESRGMLGLQSWLVSGEDAFRLSHEFFGTNRRLIRNVKRTRWNSQRPCDFEFFDSVPIPIAALASYWLWLLYVNPPSD